MSDFIRKVVFRIIFSFWVSKILLTLMTCWSCFKDDTLLCLIGHVSLTIELLPSSDIKHWTHPHSTPPTQNIFPPTITHPHPPKIMPHIPPPTPPTQKCGPSTPTHPKLPTLTQNNASLTASHTKYASITHI